MVEHRLAKARVGGSNPLSRSNLPSHLKLIREMTAIMAVGLSFFLLALSVLFQNARILNEGVHPS